MVEGFVTTPAVGAKLWVPYAPLGLAGVGGGKKGVESKCEEMVVISAVDGYDLECITKDKA